MCALTVLAVSCTPSPREIAFGSDMCHYCKMTIVDQQHAAQLVTQKGKIYMYDAIECMMHYLRDSEEQAFAYLLVNDFERPGILLPATESAYLISPAIPSPMGAFLSAFESTASARAMQEVKGGDVYDWNQLTVHFGGKKPIALTK